MRGPEPRSIRKSAEAELMDFADDIAYAVHDVEDFYRTGLIPLDRLVSNTDEVEKFLNGTFDNLARSGKNPQFTISECKETFTELLASAPFIEPYSGTGEQRARLRSFTSGRIGRYITGIKLRVPSGQPERKVEVDRWAEKELFLLKQLTWYYVINNSALASQQFGQRNIIRYLFETFNKAATENNLDLFPPSTRDRIINLNKNSPGSAKESQIRIVADLIAGMTENQAISMYQRLTGTNLGSVLNVIVR